MTVAWEDASAASRAGATAIFKFRYRNTASNSGIHYPGVKVFSSDARVRTSTDDHGDPAVHPDFYMLAECSSEETGMQIHLVDDVPSGTRFTLRMEPAVATGDSIDSCGDTLRKSTFDAVVP